MQPTRFFVPVLASFITIGCKSAIVPAQTAYEAGPNSCVASAKIISIIPNAARPNAKTTHWLATAVVTEVQGCGSGVGYAINAGDSLKVHIEGGAQKSAQTRKKTLLKKGDNFKAVWYISQRPGINSQTFTIYEYNKLP